ncbi:TERF1-interacting nuclear factor 2 isoform X2 [Hoplias malabaricus]|uniref:TERF1-interacting nuclear factor 2 isoform X2 n=1 Tax=Hoplias malabaricus TaxID=27720 RepID=UPI0034618E2A
MRNMERDTNKGDPLPAASLRLLAPPVRLVSAAAWKVMKQRDVMHFGKLEEFVTSVSDTVPGLLTYRHLAKLTVGLRARLILEQLRVSQSPNAELILPQLERMCVPIPPKGKRKDQKVEMAVKHFHNFVHTLLKNTAARRRFFLEEFDAQYGPEYDTALEKLLWEFLTRLDQLLPVPDLAQTVSWLSAAPAVLEECAQSVSQPQLLRTLLQHEKCLGHMDSAASVPSTTGDSILSSLSLPPSGKVMQTRQSGSAPAQDIDASPTSLVERSSRRQSKRTVSETASVIGTVSSKNLSLRASASQDMASVSERELKVDSATKEASTCTSVKLGSCSESELVENGKEKEEFLGNMLVNVVSQTSTSSEEENSAETKVQQAKRCSRRRSVVNKQETRSSPRMLERERMRNEEWPDDGRKMSLRSAGDITCHEGKDMSAVLNSCMKRQLRVTIPRLEIRDVTQPMLITTDNKEQTTKTDGACRIRSGDSVSVKRKLCNPETPEKNMNRTHKQVCAGSPCFPTLMRVGLDSSDYKGAALALRLEKLA